MKSSILMVNLILLSVYLLPGYTVAQNHVLSQENEHHGDMIGDATLVAMELPMNAEQIVSDTLSVKAWKQLDFKTGALQLAITVLSIRKLPVRIEIYDSVNQLLFKGTNAERETLIWTVPDDVEGDVRIVARQTDGGGNKRTGETIVMTQRFGTGKLSGSGTGKQSGGSMKDKVGLWRNYEYIDGLASNWIFPILEAADGALWIGTLGGGVSRFDGQTWQTFTKDDGLAGNNVLSMLQPQDGMLWFGTNEGLSRRVYTEQSRNDEQQWETLTDDGLAGKRISALLQTKDGALWVGAGGALLNYNGQQWYTFTQEDGWPGGGAVSLLQTQDGTLWVGTGGKGLHRYDGQTWQTYTVSDGLADNNVYALLQTEEGALWAGLHRGGVSMYDWQNWKTYSTGDGFPPRITLVLLQTQDGMLWVGGNGGLSRFDGQTWHTPRLRVGFVQSLVEAADGTLLIGTRNGLYHYYREQWQNITTDDGLASNKVKSLLQDENGVIWVGTDDGLCRYDGQTWHTFTTDDGLVSNKIRSLAQTSDGALWAGTDYTGRPLSGLSRYNGREWITFTTDDGLSKKGVSSLLQTSDGALWVGGSNSWRDYSGLSRYDRQMWQAFDVPYGTGRTELLQSQDGALWVGTHYGGSGILRYDGKEWTRFTVDDGLAGNSIESLFQTPDGKLWVGTNTGLSCYDGESWSSFTQKDGLMGLSVQAILQTSDGKLWLGTRDGGLNVYDKRCFQSINTEDGLLSNNVTSLLQAADGALWVGTDKGISRIIPGKTAPRPWIRRITADDERFENPKGKIQVSGPVERLSVEYRGITFHTRKGGIKYFTQLVDVEQAVSLLSVEHAASLLSVGHSASLPDGWSKPTNNERVEYTNLPPGDYTFKMQAVDRFLNYSEIASLTLKVVPPFYMRAVFLAPTISFGTILLATLIILAISLVKRRRQVRAYEQTAVEELQDARQMQMSLMPESAPPIEGFEITGRCVPANTVSGDFFDYLSPWNGRIGIAIADVVGKGLKSAMNAVLTNGMLHEVAKIQASCGNILTALNASLYPRMEKQMFTALGLAILDPDKKTLQWAGAAQPYPLVKRGDEVFEFESEGELPLGMTPNVTYSDSELELQSGDIVIFYTDGILEAENEVEEMYEIQRLQQSIKQINSTLNAEEILETILGDIADFVGSGEQYDDITIVVVKMF